MYVRVCVCSFKVSNKKEKFDSECSVTGNKNHQKIHTSFSMCDYNILNRFRGIGFHFFSTHPHFWQYLYVQSFPFTLFEM